MRPLFSIMLILSLFCSGFTWGKSKEENCKEVNELVFKQQLKNPDVLPDDLEHKVAGLCPGGAAYIFLEGLKYELSKQVDRAIKSYESVIKIDEHFPYAHGRLGLLQLKNNNRGESIVSLTRALEEGGTGLVTLPLPQHLRSIVGLDSSQGMLENLQKKVRAFRCPNVRAIRCDLEKGELPARKFHLIISSMTLHHIPKIVPV